VSFARTPFGVAKGEIMAHGRFRSFPNHFLMVVLAACAVACGSVSSAGDPPQLAHAYGNGVHAYFAGDFQRAYEDLSEAVEGGTHDPRVWYFRGLAALKLGRTDEAEADFSTAARRESEGTGAWPVAKSLERVQGCDRLKLERHRARAGIASLQQDRQRSNLRYLEVERARPDVTRTIVPIEEQPADDATRFKEGAVGNLPAPEDAPVDSPTVDAPETESPIEPALNP
jgi:tetratricopeptide (TPR) repeat protein